LLVLAGLLASASFMTIYPAMASASAAPKVLGELPGQKLLTRQLTDRASLLVNVADGNLILQSQDFHLNGLGPNLSITRYFNNRATSSGQAGSRDTLSIGSDVHITKHADGSATYQGPSGFQVTYQPDGHGGYTMPSNYTRAKLSHTSSGGWKLTFNQSGEAYTFNNDGNQIKDASKNGQAITYSYDNSGKLTKASDTEGHITTFGYHFSKYISSINGPNNRERDFSYSNGNLTGVNDGPGEAWSYSYANGGNLSKIKDPNGNRTKLDYDSSSRVTAIHYGNATQTKATWQYSYQDGKTIVTDPLGHQTTYTYDNNGRVTDVIDAVGNHRSASYDARGNATSLKSAAGSKLSLTYDKLNNLSSIQSPSLSNGNSGAKTSFAYGSSAHPYSTTKATDAAGNHVAYSYDTAGNLMSASATSADGKAMGEVSRQLQGDDNGNGGSVECGAQKGEICSTTDAKGHKTTYGYDSKGNVTSINYPDPVGTETLTYDRVDRVKTITKGNGTSKTFQYDGDGRIIRITYGHNPRNYVTYSYDDNGNLTSFGGIGTTGSSSGHQHRTYDYANRVTQVEPNQGDTIHYTYNKAGNLTKVKSRGAGATTYTYTAANQVATVTRPHNGGTESFSYTNGQPTKIIIPGSITETIGYDQAGRETSIKATRNGTTLTNYTGTYTNTAGYDTNLLQKETDHVKGVTKKYSYDGLGRLVKVNASGNDANSYAYSYDKNGNRTKVTHNNNAGPTYGYNDANELSTKDSHPANVTYDKAGNQTKLGSGLKLSYSSSNQTSTFTLNNGTKLHAQYVADGQTVRDQFGRTPNVGPFVGAIVASNGLLGLYSEKNVSDFGAPTTYYTHLPTGGHQALGETIGTSNYYYLTDLHGSVVNVTNQSGTVKATYTYSPYGQTLSHTGNIANPYQFAGGYHDEATGLYHFGARYYNPKSGRWTQLDPTGQSQGYVYAKDDPVNFVDLSGKFSFLDLVALANATFDYAKTGAAIGLAAGCAGGAIGASVTLTPLAAAGGCAVGGGEGAVEGAIVFGVAGFFYYGVTGNDPFAGVE
jgi:RHS repeat-associated protein